MSTSPIFNERVYPIKGSIRLEVDDIESLDGDRYSTPVRIGKCYWRLLCKNTEQADPKYLSVFLKCMTKLEQGESIDLVFTRNLINQTKSGEDVSVKGTNKFDERNDNWGTTKFVEWSKLLSGGYVKDRKIVVVWDVTINSENVKKRKIAFWQERPNEMDLKNMLGVKNPFRIERFEEEFVVFEISEQTNFSEPVTVFCLPAKVCVKKNLKNGENFLSLHLNLNYDDKSDWWRCKLRFTVTLVNQSKTKKNFSQFYINTYHVKASNWGWSSFIKWSELVNPSNGYVEDGKIKLQISLQMLEMYGFDKNTRRGIDMPMRKMTDAVFTVGDKKLHVSKKILAQQSTHFKNLFSSNPGKVDFEINAKLDDMIRLLELIHNVDTNVCEQNVEALLELIRTYKAPECYERLDSIVKNLELEDTMKVLEWVDKYPLPKLRNKFLLKLKDEELLKSITHSQRYKALSSDMKVAILEWKLIPEESRTEDVEPASYQFSTDFDEETDMTDIEINVNDYNYYASKQILANASHFFMKKFYGPYSEDTSEVRVFDVTPREFEKLLTHIYHPTRPVTSGNIDSLLQLAHQFSVPRLMDKCEEYLVISDNIPLIEKLEYAGEFDLPYLLESCLKLTSNSEKMKEVKEHYKFPHLAPKVLAELLKREPRN